MVVQYYPGHMAKAIREIKEKLNLIEVVFELVDARIPISSQNPYIQDMIQTKPRVVILTKIDKADPRKTKEWREHFKQQGIITVGVNSMDKTGYRELIPAAKEAMKDLLERNKEKGLKERAIRALITGIPNVGKSTFINKLAQRKATSVGDKPGVTRTQTWIKVGKELELLDTPGLLWNKFEPIDVGYKLALTGAIPDTVLPMDDVVIYGIKFLLEHYPNAINKKYGIDSEDPIEILDHIGKMRGAVRNREVDYDRVFNAFLYDLRHNQLGKVTLDV